MTQAMHMLSFALGVLLVAAAFSADLKVPNDTVHRQDTWTAVTILVGACFIWFGWPG